MIYIENYFFHISIYLNELSYFKKLPKVLITHIHRYYFDYTTLRTEKIINNFLIDRNIEILNYFENNNYHYTLFATVVHSGNAQNGHYFVLFRFIRNNEFSYWKFDSLSITEIDENEFVKISNGNIDDNSCDTIAFYVQNDYFLDCAAL